MKLEDIKPGDVLVLTLDGTVNKVAGITSDGSILRSAYTYKNNKFCVYINPIRSPYSADYFEPATDKQRQYIESKLAAFFGCDPHLEDNKNIDWEQRRYEIAKEMLHDCVEYYDDLNSIINVDIRVESSTELAIKYADALIEKLKREEVQND